MRPLPTRIAESAGSGFIERVAVDHDEAILFGLEDGVLLPSAHDANGGFDCRAVRSASSWRDVRYQLLTDSAVGGGPSYRVYAGTTLIAEVRTLTDAGRALAAHADSFVAERAPDHLFVHAGVVGWNGSAIVMPGAQLRRQDDAGQGMAESGRDVLLR